MIHYLEGMNIFCFGRQRLFKGRAQPCSRGAGTACRNHRQRREGQLTDTTTEQVDELCLAVTSASKILRRKKDERNHTYKNGELALRDRTAAALKKPFMKNIRRRIKPLGEADVHAAQSTVYIEPKDESFDTAEAARRVFENFRHCGIHPSAVTEKDMDSIKKTAAEYLEKQLSAAKNL